jgi:putative transposase
MQKRAHSREFKLEVVRQIATGQKRPAQVCREYGLADSVLSRLPQGIPAARRRGFWPHRR